MYPLLMEKKPISNWILLRYKVVAWDSYATMRVDIYLPKVPFTLFSSHLLHVEL